MGALRKRKKRSVKKRPEKLWYAIYVILNRISNEKYCGFTKCPNKDYVAALGKRFDFHIKRSIKYNDTLICQNIRKYGKNNFQIVFMEHVQGKQNTLDREKELIKTGDYVLNMEHRMSRKKTHKSILTRLVLPTDRIPTHPGVLLSMDYLPYFNVSRERFAEYLKLTPEQLNSLLKGELDITIVQAIALSKLFDTSIKYWLKLQSDHRLSVTIREIDMDHYTNIPKLQPHEFKE